MKNLSIAAIAAFMLCSCEKQNSSMAIESTNVNESSVAIKAYMYKRADLIKLLGKKMDGIRFYKDGHAAGVIMDKDGDYNDDLASVVSVYPCPDWCGKVKK